MFAALSDFVIASTEPIAILLWGVILVALSLRLRSSKAAPAQQLRAATADEPTDPSLLAGLR